MVSEKLICPLILLALNLLNYMDRFTVAGTLVDIQKFYNIKDSMLGLIQTVFVCFYMVAAPAFGYCGDRYNRKTLISIGLVVWILAVLISSVGGPFWLFLISRALVGIGEAAYSTIAPSIIGDLYNGPKRTRMLTFFFVAMPIGSGLGYIVGTSVTAWLGDWRWGIRTTPLIGIMMFILLQLFFTDPERGIADRARFPPTSYKEDLQGLWKTPTYLSVVAGQTSVMFVTGSVSWWAPALTAHAWGMLHLTTNVPEEVKASIGRTFGILTCIGGLLGVASGSAIARFWERGIEFSLNPMSFFSRLYERARLFLHLEEEVNVDDDRRSIVSWSFKFGPYDHADPSVCSLSSLAAVPMMWLALFLFGHNMNAGWVFTFLTIVFMCMNISITTDMILYIVPPNRRSTAVAIQTLVAHLLGDAASPYIVGLLSDWFHPATAGGDAEQAISNFVSLQEALFVPNFILIISALFYNKAASTVVMDRDVCILVARELDPPSILESADFTIHR